MYRQLRKPLIVGLISGSVFLLPSLDSQSSIKHITTSPTSRIPLAKCSELGNTASCKTFNEMLAHKDSDFSALQEAPITYVCFRSDIDSFFTVAFHPLSIEKYSDSDPTEISGGIRSAGMTYSSYLNGQDNGSEFILFHWTWIKGYPGTLQSIPDITERPSHGLQTVAIGDSSITFTTTFVNVKSEEVKQDIDIRRSTGRYSLSGVASGRNDFQTGRCAVYPTK